MVLPGLRSLKSLLGSSNKRSSSGRKHKEKGDAYVVDGEPVVSINSLRGGGSDTPADQRDKGSCKVAGHRQVHPENHTIDKMMDGILDVDSTTVTGNRKQDFIFTTASTIKGVPKSSRVANKKTGDDGVVNGFLPLSSSSPLMMPYDHNGLQQKSTFHQRHSPVVVVESEKLDGKENLPTFVRGGDRAKNLLTSWDSSSSYLCKDDYGGVGHFQSVSDFGGVQDPISEYGESLEKHDPVKDCLERRVKELEKQLEDERQRVAFLEKEQSFGHERANEMHHRDMKYEQIKKNVIEEKWKAECDAYKAQVACLHDEMRKKELVMQNILKFQSKLRQISQEKSSIQMLHERKLHNCQLTIIRLEKLNKLLVSEIKNLENVASAVGSCTSCRSSMESREELSMNGVSLERLKYLEAENSSLVVENEQQRMQYEKCLDDVANQVVQALLVQKSLQGECSNLRKHVADLEQQNQTLQILFQQQLQRTCDRRIQFGGSFTLPDTRISTGFHCLPRASSHLCENECYRPNALRSTCSRDRSTSPATGQSLSCTSINSDCCTVDPSHRHLDMTSPQDKDKHSSSEKTQGQQKAQCQFMASSHCRRQNLFPSRKEESCWTNYRTNCVTRECCLPGNCRGCCPCVEYCGISNEMVTRSLPINGSFCHRPKRRPASHSLVMGMADLLRLNGLKNRAHLVDDAVVTSVGHCVDSNVRSNCRFGLTAKPVSIGACEPLCFVRTCPTRFTMEDGDISSRGVEVKNDDCNEFCKSSLIHNNLCEISSNCHVELELNNPRWRPREDSGGTSSCDLNRKRQSLISNVLQETEIQPNRLLPSTVGWKDTCNCNSLLVCRLHHKAWQDYQSSVQERQCIGSSVANEGNAIDSGLFSKECIENGSFETVTKDGDVNDTNNSSITANSDVNLNEKSLRGSNEVSLNNTASLSVVGSEERSTTTLVSRDEGYSTMSSDVQCDGEIGDQNRNTSPEFFTFKVSTSKEVCDGDTSNEMHLTALIESQESYVLDLLSKDDVKKVKNQKLTTGCVDQSDDGNSVFVKETMHGCPSVAPKLCLDSESIVPESSPFEHNLVGAIAGDNFNMSMYDVSKTSTDNFSSPTVYRGGLRRTKSEGDGFVLSKRQMFRSGCGSAFDITRQVSVAAASSSVLRRSKGCLSLTEDVSCDDSQSNARHVDRVTQEWHSHFPPASLDSLHSLCSGSGEAAGFLHQLSTSCTFAFNSQEETFASFPSNDDDEDWFMVENFDCLQDCCSTPERQVVAAVNCYSDEEICNWSLNFSSDDICSSQKKLEGSDSSRCSVKRLTNRSSFWSQPSGSLPSIQEVDVDWDFFSSLPSKARLVHLRFLRDRECRRVWRKIRRRDGTCRSWPCEADDTRCRSKEAQKIDSLGDWDSSASCATSKGMSMSSVTDEEQLGGNSRNGLPVCCHDSTPPPYLDEDRKICTRAPQSNEEGDCSPVETHFKSDFYMLCKVESCRSLNVSCKNLITGTRPDCDGSFLLKGIARSSERPLVFVESVPCSKSVCRKEGDNCAARNLVKQTLHELSVMLNNIECGYNDDEENATDGVARGSIGRNSVVAGEDCVCSRDNDQPMDSQSVKEGLTTSWVHFETDVDLSDPKARANLLDSMLASSTSSSDTEADNSSSISTEDDEEEEDDDIEVSALVNGGEERATHCKYQQLHEIHRIRRFKRAATDRDQCVMRYIPSPRPSILDRKDFFYRYGEKEQEAVASFDFLESMSTSVSDVGSLETLNERGRGSPRRRNCDPEANTYKIGRTSVSSISGLACEDDDNHNRHRGHIRVTGGEGFSDVRTKSGCNGSLYRDFSAEMNLSVLTLTSQEDVDAIDRLSLSDSCAESFSCSSSSLNLDV